MKTINTWNFSPGKEWINSICRSWERLYTNRELGGILIVGGPPWEGQKHKAEGADVRNEGPTRVKVLCLLIEKGSLAQLNETRLWGNLEPPGRNLEWIMQRRPREAVAWLLSRGVP